MVKISPTISSPCPSYPKPFNPLSRLRSKFSVGHIPPEPPLNLPKGKVKGRNPLQTVVSRLVCFKEIQLRCISLNRNVLSHIPVIKSTRLQRCFLLSNACGKPHASDCVKNAWSCVFKRKKTTQISLICVLIQSIYSIHTVHQLKSLT